MSGRSQTYSQRNRRAIRFHQASRLISWILDTDGNITMDEISFKLPSLIADDKKRPLTPFIISIERCKNAPVASGI